MSRTSQEYFDECQRLQREDTEYNANQDDMFWWHQQNLEMEESQSE